MFALEHQANRSSGNAVFSGIAKKDAKKLIKFFLGYFFYNVCFNRTFKFFIFFGKERSKIWGNLFSDGGDILRSWFDILLLLEPSKSDESSNQVVESFRLFFSANASRQVGFS